MTDIRSTSSGRTAAAVGGASEGGGGGADIEQGSAGERASLALAPPSSPDMRHGRRHGAAQAIDLTNRTESDQSSLDRHSGASEPIHKDRDDGGRRGNSAATRVSLVSSSVVCFVIYLVFCIVFSSVTWNPLAPATTYAYDIDPPFGIPQGVGINLMGIAVGSVLFGRGSGCKCIVAGTDLIPVVFFAEAGASVVAYLADRSSPDPCDAGDGHRRLRSDDAGADPCSDPYRRSLAGAGPYLEQELISKVVPTTLVAMMIGNITTGLIFYGLGKMKNTASVIGFIPAGVVAGFLTCIGYKVIKLAWLITTGYAFKEKYIRNVGKDLPHANDPWLPLLIASIYGVLLYGLKRLHLVAAEKLILGFITVPLVIFFAIVGAKGVSMQYLRDTDWFLTQIRGEDGCSSNCPFTIVNFWQTLEVAYGGLFSDLIEWRAIPRCIPIFIMGSVITSLDSMLKLTSSENALGIDLDYNHEMKLGGKATIISGILAGSPAYGQTKFNVINFSIARTAESPVPTLLLGMICTVVFLSGVSGVIINIMPRFLLGGLCVFAGMGFLYENLWEGRKIMSRVSFAIVWVIFLLNFIWEFFVLQNLDPAIQPMVPGLLVVFVLGIVLSTFEFMFAFMHKAKPPEVRDGSGCCSSAVRSEKHNDQLAVMAPWFQVFSVESFVFFGTANALYQQLKFHIEKQKSGEDAKPTAERTKYLIFDLVEVTGIDSSARNVFFKIHRLLKAEGIKIVWAMNSPKLVKHFDAWGLYAGTPGHESTPGHFRSLDLALRHVEDALLNYAAKLSDKWLKEDTVRSIFEWHVLANIFNISVRSDERNFCPARLQPWSKRATIMKGEELCGPDDDNLYLLYSGEVEIRGCSGDSHSVFTGGFFNLDRMLISVGALQGPPSTLGAIAKEESTVLSISRKNFLAIPHVDGALAQKLMMTLIVQNESNRPGKNRVRVPRSHVAGLGKDCRHGKELGSTAMRLLSGDDYEISLTDAQEQRFGQVFDHILSDCEAGAKEVPMETFANYVCMEARALGSQLGCGQFMRMINDSGIDENGDGSLSKDEFLSFLRGLFLAGIPSSELPTLRKAYDDAVAESPDQPMDESRVQVIFDSLGFDVSSTGWQDAVGVIDADGDGEVDFSEFLTGVGMMKRYCLLSSKLDEAFRKYKNGASMGIMHASYPKCRNFGYIAQVEDKPNRARAMDSTWLVGETLSRNFNRNSAKQSNGIEIRHEVSRPEIMELSVQDLQAFLGVTRQSAEEMVFLADEDDADATVGEDGEVNAVRTIDRQEFQQLIRNWS